MASVARAAGSIGVFDSGFGGLHTLKHLVALLPRYDYIYLGDSARAPYGPRSTEEVCAFSTQAVDFLFAQGCDLIIFACNTASSDALHAIQTSYLPHAYPSKRVLGVLIPLCEMAVATTRNKKIGVIATEGTVRSGAFAREIHKLDPDIEVFQNHAPGLVPLVESGDYADARELLEAYLQPLMHKGIDTLILGCTHYGFLIDSIRAIVGPDISVISDADAVPPSLRRYLDRHPEIDERLSQEGKRTFYTSDTTDRFAELGPVFFGHPLSVRSVML